MIDARGWRFKPAPLAPAAACLPAKGRVGRRSIGALRLGQTASAALRVAPIPTKRTKRAWRWCVTGGGRVSAAVVNGRIAAARRDGPGLPAGEGAGQAAGAGTCGGSALGGSPASAHGRVRFVAVASAATLRNRALLRKRLRAAGLRS